MTALELVELALALVGTYHVGRHAYRLEQRARTALAHRRARRAAEWERTRRRIDRMHHVAAGRRGYATLAMLDDHEAE